ncbi:MAG: stage IV sporulation protein A [Clostridiales bacterium]|nr:stage IV sporulation protein A [Clostridiales bacterium]
MDKFELYRDIASRTGGDIYVGVVGPVRTGKSTLIKQVMQQLVIDGIENPDERSRAIDEIPQSADGKTIMTTQPRFVPNEAVRVPVSENLAVNMRLIDCVGYLVAGALGAEEDGKERMVSTPWSEEQIPFSKAAEIGTQKVIKEHSTIALAVTTDGSFSNIGREQYIEAEERVIRELKECGKPFAIVLNVADPEAASAIQLKDELSKKYDAPVLLKNAVELGEQDITEILETILLEFAVNIIDFDLPRWVQALPADSSVVKELIGIVKGVGDDVSKMKDYERIDAFFKTAEYWDEPSAINLDAGKGRVQVDIMPKDGVFFKVASEECGIDISDNFDLLAQLKKLCRGREKIERINAAMEQVDAFGYGIVLPTMDEIELQEPKLLRQGQQYGVQLKAHAPSLHIMKVDVETEVSPLVGSEQQSKEFVDNMVQDFENDKQSILDTNIFGRPLSALVADGISNKLQTIPSDAENKLRKTLGRIVNEGRGGVICILL